MPLKSLLSGIIESVDGGLAAVIVASDGITIDEVVPVQTGFDLQLLTVEYASVVKEIRRAVEVVKAGEMEEFAVTTGRLYVVVRLLASDLFAILVMERGGNLGKGRYLLRLKSDDLLRELQ